MIRQILIPLDPDEDTPVAVRYAVELARRTGASLTGLAIMDSGRIATSAYGGGIGTIQYAEQLRHLMADETGREAEKLLKLFKAIAKKASIEYHTTRIEEGAPHDKIIEDSKYHDLVVIGRKSHFFYCRADEETKTLSKIVKNSVGPILVVGELYREITKVLVAFDSSSAVARTLQWFIHLQPYGKDLEIDLIHVPSDGSELEKANSNMVLRLAENYLNVHGFERTNRIIPRSGTPGKVILEHQNTTGADLILLGAHSMAALRRITFGSTTHYLVTNSIAPLFLYH